MGTGASDTPFQSWDAGDVGRTDTGDTDAEGHTIYSYGVDFDEGVHLGADTTDYLSISNDTINSLQTWFWSGSDRDDSRAGYYANVDSTGWVESTVPPNLAFNLTGKIVPEPLTTSLLGLGMGGLVARRYLK